MHTPRLLVRSVIAAALGLVPAHGSLSQGDVCAVPSSVDPGPTREASPAEIAKLEGAAFFDALTRLSLPKDGPIDDDDLWVLLERCQLEVQALGADTQGRPERFRQEYACVTLADRVVDQGTREDLSRLLATFEGTRSDGIFATLLIDQVLDRRLFLATQVLVPGDGLPALADEGPLPATARKLPSELRQAWAQHAALSKLYTEALVTLAHEDGLAVQPRFPQFHRAIWDFLRDRMSAGEAEATIGRYVWSGWCGTGSDSLTTPQRKVLALAWIELGRYDLAAGALLSLQGAHIGQASVPAEAFQHVLAAAGFDWEALAAVTFAVTPYSAGNLLGTRGSERGAELLMALADVRNGQDYDEAAPVSEAPEYLEELASFVAADSRCQSGHMGLSLRSVRTGPSAVTPATEARILDLLASHIQPGSGREEAEAAATLLGNLCRPESVPAFRTMLTSPYPDVQRVGYDGLQAYGEAPAGGFTPARPVAFRLLANGQALASKDVQYELHLPGGSSLSSTAKTDAAGLLTLERAYFVDPKRRVQKVEFWLPDSGAAGAPRLVVSGRPPTDLARVTSMRLSAAHDSKP